MRCIEARLRLEREKEQQETLILSVIPAHIGRMENMSADLINEISFSTEYEIGNVTEGERNSQVSQFTIARLRRPTIAREENQRSKGGVSRFVHQEA